MTPVAAMVPGPPGEGLHRALVVDDVPSVRLVARAALEARGFDVVEAPDGETAVELVGPGTVDLVVLDVNLPRMSGLAALNRIRQASDVPVILLTARGEEGDRVLGLELGADDYVVKPFSPAELGARATSLVRRWARPGPPAAPGAPAGPAEPVVVHVGERRVTVDGEVVALTPREFDLLACLAGAPRRAFSRAELLEGVWSSSVDWQDAATVTEHVRRLRRKIEVDPEHPAVLCTVRGVGYRFEPGDRVRLVD